MKVIILILLALVMVYLAFGPLATSFLVISLLVGSRISTVTKPKGKMLEIVLGSLPTEAPNEHHGGWERTKDGKGWQREV